MATIQEYKELSVRERQNRYFSEEFKRKKVSEIDRNISTIAEVSKEKISQTSISIPDSVVVILRNSCNSCHDEGGKKLAMMKWNFSKWDTYAANKQANKAIAICNAMKSGSMPPNSVKKANPEKMPTAEQIGIVCKWATSIQVK